jgi:hypothetical protein
MEKGELRVFLLATLALGNCRSRMKLKKTKELHIYNIIYVCQGIFQDSFRTFRELFGTFFWPFFRLFASFLDLGPLFSAFLGHFQIYWAIRMGIFFGNFGGFFGTFLGDFWR